MRGSGQSPVRGDRHEGRCSELISFVSFLWRQLCRAIEPDTGATVMCYGGSKRQSWGKGQDNYVTCPGTGDVVNPQGELVENLGD